MLLKVLAGPSIVTDHHPTIEISETDIKQKSGIGGGPSVLKLEVIDEDGSFGAIFWVSIGIKGGKPKVTLSTETMGGKRQSKHITGVFDRKQ